MSEPVVKLEIADHIAHVILNRPEYRNAQSRILLETLDQAFSEAVNDPSVKVILLRAEGDHFCAGHDLGSPPELEDQSTRPYPDGLRGRFERSESLYVEFTMKWRNLPKPTIAVVQGYCIFAGWMVASAMDMIFAAKDAMFLGTNFQYFSIPWDMHPRKAKELLFESRFINGTEAQQLDIVNRTYDRSDLLKASIDYASRVALNDPFQLKMIKAAINQVQDTQGFNAHITAAHGMHLMSITAEQDPDYALKVPSGRRRPMVQRAMENYDKHQQTQQQQ